MTDDDRRGTTDDPNQADRTGAPHRPDRNPKVPLADRPKTPSNDDGPTGPGTITDPNQADRT